MKEVILGVAAISVFASGLAFFVTQPQPQQKSSLPRRNRRRRAARRDSESESDNEHLKPPRITRRRSPSESDLSVLSDGSRSDVSCETTSTSTEYSDDGGEGALLAKVKALEEQLEYASGIQIETRVEYDAKVASVQASMAKWQKETEKKWKSEVEAGLKERYETQLVVAHEEVSRLKKQCALLNREMHKERARNQGLSSDGASIRSRASMQSLRSRRESLVPTTP